MSLLTVTVLVDPPWCLIPSLTSLTATMVSSLKLLHSSIWEWDCEIHTSSYCTYTLYRVQFISVVLTQRAEALSTNTLTREIYKLKKYRKYRTFFGKYRNLQDRPKNKEIQDTLGGLGTCLRLLFNVSRYFVCIKCTARHKFLAGLDHKPSSVRTRLIV